MVIFNKGGQVTIFVIIALAIVGILIVYFAFPGALPFVGASTVNPTVYLSECITPALEEIMPIVSARGGYSEPTHYLTYEGERIQYLCYTDSDYEPCLVMQPLLKQYVEQEVENYIRPRARACVTDLTEEYERAGYTVNSQPGEVSAEFVTGSLKLDFFSPMTVSKESTQTFQHFSVRVPSEMYDLLLTASSIIQFESTLGDSETTLYLQYYPDLKIEKIKRDADTIYTLSNVVTDESFTFATRSLVWPTGYGLEEL